MSTIREIKELSYKQKYEPWLTRNFYRRIAVYFTWIFLHTNITPNQITLITILMGFLSAFFFLSGAYTYSLIGALLFQLTYIIDCCDGDVARFKNLCSPKGHYYGRLYHSLVDSVIFLAIGIGLFRGLDNIIYLYLGILIMFSHLMFSVFVAEKYRVYYEYKLLPLKARTNIKNRKSFIEFSMVLSKKIFDKVGIIFRQPIHYNIILFGAIFNLLNLVIILFAIFKPIITLGTFIYETQIRFKSFE